MVETLICSSCKTRICNMRGSTRFVCPSCDQFELIRCVQCRQIAAPFTCPSCQFTGPN